MHASEERIRAAELYTAGKLDRARRALGAAQRACPEESSTSWQLEIDTLHSLGLHSEALALARQIAGSPAASQRDRELASAWVARPPAAGSGSGQEWLDAGLEKQAGGDTVGAQRALDRALVELEAQAGKAAVLEPRRALWDVSAMSWSPDGGTLAVASGSRIHAFTTDHYREVLRIETGHPRILDIAISPDSRLIAASSAQAEVTLWDLRSGNELGTLRAEGNGLRTLVFSPDGELLAGSSWEELRAPVWRVASRALERTLVPEQGNARLSGARGASTDPGSWPQMLAFSPDGTQLLGAFDRSLLFWELSSEKTSVARALSAGSPSSGEGTLYSVAFDPKSHRAASGTDAGRIVLWNLASGTALASVRAQQLAPLLQFSRDGKRLLSVSLDGSVRTFEAHSLAPLGSYRTPLRFADATAAEPDARAAALSAEGALLVQDALSGALTRVLEPGLPLSALAVPGGLGEIALGTTQGGVGLLRSSTAELQWLKGHTGAISSLAFSPDSSELASAALDKTVRVWDARSGAARQVLVHSTPVTALAYPADAHVLATGGEDGVVHVWDTASGKVIKTLEGSACAILALHFSPDAAWLVANTADHLVLRWDAKSYAKQPAAPRGFTCSGELSPSHHGLASTKDGQLIASAPGGSTIELWKASTGEQVGSLGEAPRLSYVSSVAISPRDPLLVAAAAGRVHAWRLPEKTELELPQAAADVEALEFSADGRLLFGWTGRGSVSIWKVAPGAAAVQFQLSLELSSETSATALSADGLVERLGAPAPAACVLGVHVYPAALCEERYLTTGLLARTLAAGAATR